MNSKIEPYPIETWRERYCMSRSDLAKRLGVSTSSVRRWEAGETMPSTYVLIKLGELFECGTDGIFLPFQSKKCEESCGNN